MPLKRNWPTLKEQEKKREEDNLYKKLKGEAQIIRRQGEPPRKNPLTFSKYLCDLCGTSHSVSELKQCAVCGKWACQACWNSEYYLCNSCAGIVKLMQYSPER